MIEHDGELIGECRRATWQWNQTYDKTSEESAADFGSCDPNFQNLILILHDCETPSRRSFKQLMPPKNTFGGTLTGLLCVLCTSSDRKH